MATPALRRVPSARYGQNVAPGGAVGTAVQRRRLTCSVCMGWLDRRRGGRVSSEDLRDLRVSRAVAGEHVPPVTLVRKLHGLRHTLILIVFAGFRAADLWMTRHQAIEEKRQHAFLGENLAMGIPLVFCYAKAMYIPTESQ